MRIIKSITAIIVGIIAGSIVNVGIIFLGNLIFGAPEGMNLADAESVKAHADKLTIGNLLSAFLAHQLGTLLGAFIAAKIAPFRKMIFAFVIGLWFLGCGIYAASLIPASIWFMVADFALYIPIAFIGWKLADGRKQQKI